MKIKIDCEDLADILSVPKRIDQPTRLTKKKRINYLW